MGRINWFRSKLKLASQYRPTEEWIKPSNITNKLKSDTTRTLKCP